MAEQVQGRSVGMGKRLCDLELPRGRESKRESKREHLFLLRKYDRRDKLEDGMPPAAAGRVWR